MSETLADIEIRHKKEKKDLFAKIQNLKKSSGKLDKKKKKELQDDVLRLESELESKHLDEMNAFKSKDPTIDVDSNIIELLKDVSIAPRVSKAQKRRDKKMAEGKAREKEILEQEIENVNGPRNLENKTIKSMLKEKGLSVYQIPSNGDCLYGAISHQLTQTGKPHISVKELRKLTSSHIELERDKYMPFISHPETGDMLTGEEFDSYCRDIVETTTWGGEVELQALSAVLKSPIHVLQAAAPRLIIQGAEYPGNPLVVTYHRHMYGLGEHYNSTQPFVEENEEEDNNISVNN